MTGHERQEYQKALAEAWKIDDDSPEHQAELKRLAAEMNAAIAATFPDATNIREILDKPHSRTATDTPATELGVHRPFHRLSDFRFVERSAPVVNNLLQFRREAEAGAVGPGLSNVELIVLERDHRKQTRTSDAIALRVEDRVRAAALLTKLRADAFGREDAAACKAGCLG